MTVFKEGSFAHYGILRKSGRYPWGSGDNTESRSRDFLGMVDSLRKQGMSQAEIAKALGLDSTTDLRAANSIAKNQRKLADIAMAQRLSEKGFSNGAIAARMGLPGESSVRALLAPGVKTRSDILKATSDMLRGQVAEKKYIDVGVEVERQIGVSKERLGTAVKMLKEEGYTLHYIQVPQLGTGEKTTVKVLAGPNVGYSEVSRNRDQIQQIKPYTDDGGLTYKSPSPLAVSSNRVGVRYKEQGGANADGVIYVRPGVPDLSLGGSRYAQVRVSVDGTHFLKGMAMYKDDLPTGTDLLFNTNKSDTGNKLDAMKPMKTLKDGTIDPDLPFGSITRPASTKKDAHGNDIATSVMNKVNEEGNWEEWSSKLSSQFLSKQSPVLAQTQLDMTYESSKNEFDGIMALTNPSVRKKLLQTFSDSADASAVHLKAAGLPRTANRVILPIESMKPTEVYAPQFNNGERVVLIRHPHGGIFEIPELTVNNHQPEAKRLLGAVEDAIGIHPKVAEKLSGADFDGDTVLVIPNNKGLVQHSPSLDKLKNFDPKEMYKLPDDAPKMSAKTKGIEMGKVSNLITDMTLRGANPSEIAQAVRHSMVVIDAEKHHLNYKQSEIDNGIAALKEKYQGGKDAGASTLISRAGSQIRVPDREPRSMKEGGPIDPVTGKKVYTPTGATREVSKTNKKGITTTKTIPVERVSKRLAETDDAHTLVSANGGTRIEKIYADHSNKMKDLANQARVAMVHTKGTPLSTSAKTAYQKEVASLDAKLDIALRNSPRERQAQLVGNAIVSQKKRANPDMERDELKKVTSQALNEARMRTGAGKERIEITPSEWDAIQAGAISPSKLDKILNNANIEQLKELAMPKSSVLMTSAKQARARQMAAQGYTQAEIAGALGVSVSTLKRNLSGGA